MPTTNNDLVLGPSRKVKGDVKTVRMTYADGSVEECHIGENDIFLITTGTCHIDQWSINAETEEVTIEIAGFPV